MPDPQPGQMEQRMERSKDADVAWLMRWFGNGECCTQHTREHLGSIVARLTRPTADLGDDGERAGWEDRARRTISEQGSGLSLEQVTAQRDLWIMSASDWEARLKAAADRLILYREALEAILAPAPFRDIKWAGMTLGDIARAALTHARQEGDK